MLKLVGAVLVLGAGTLAGFYQAQQFAARPRQLRELILALQRLETEISYGFTPLPDALERIGVSLREPLKSLLASAALYMRPDYGLSAQDSIRKALGEYWRRTSMKSAEREVLEQLSGVLGTSDRQDQIKHIALAVGQLKHEEAAARDDQVKYEKMSKSLGLLIGALIVILIF
ncbi:stage III sporulation protein SpoIIIAB [Paenibacillus sp. FSL H8-0457]|uniref:stage III sporulation protein SpoIIIAB n=1 Tax=Bacillales TaxID=1385 RepID=UPI0001789581|nr:MULTISPECIES: stage III sporulation protein SpoIIIAB [Paenibacillus]ACX64373.1 stage III sporulation protein AB [Paenibacillus sp. Y412MC10]ETT57869.1 stage III sporulation protein AB [Paenibacillus sp. FSL H8-457]MCM3256697.1 stage III sporulation protein SpoIIIAB [Paenibacillus lautus]